MKNTKKALALLSTVSMLTSVVPMMPAHAENEVFDGTYLQADFDKYVPKLEAFIGDAPTKVSTDVNVYGNHHFIISPENTYSGFKFNKVYTKTDKDLSVSFDFCPQDWTDGKYAIWMTDSTEPTVKIANMMCGLVGIRGNKFRSCGQNVEGITVEQNKWYHYELIIHPSNGVKITITDKNDSTKVATYQGQVLDAVNDGEGLPNMKYDSIRFNYGGTTKIDNILVQDVNEQSIDFSVKTAHPGNIFDGKDKKEFTVTLSNLSKDLTRAWIKYYVNDVDGNRICEGLTGLKYVEGLSTNTYTFDVDITKYNCYDLYFDVYYRNMVTDQAKGFVSGNTMFSVVNKRAENEPLNHLAGSTWGTGDTTDCWQDLSTIAKDCGISALRRSYNWHAVERRKKGEYDVKDPNNADMVASGVEVYGILGDSNVCYTPTGNDWAHISIAEIGTDEVIEAYKKFLEWVTTEQKDAFSYYEVFNESQERNSPELYCKLLKITHDICKKNDPTKPVVAFCTSGVPYSWLESCIKIIGKDWKNYFDAISVHPYDFDRGEYESDPGSDSEGWSKIIRDTLYLEKTQWLVDKMAEYGYQAPIIHSEVAMSSTPGMSSMRCTAADLAQLYAVSAATESIDQVYWYSYENTSPRGREYVVHGWRNANYGIIGFKQDAVPFAAKPGYLAMAAFNKFLTNAKLVDQYVENNEVAGNMRAYRFKRPDGDQVISFWTEWGYDNCALDLGTNEIEIFDMYSNSLGKMKSSTGIYNFTSTFEPIYIKGDFTKLKRVDPVITSSNARITAVKNDTAEIILKDSKNRHLNVEVKTNPNTTVVSKTDIVNGEGKIVVKTNDKVEDEEPIEISVYENGNLVYYSRHHLIISKEALKVNYSTGKDPQNGKDVFTVSATNKTAGTTLQGDVKADFTTIGGNLVENKIENLKAGETRTVYLDLPTFEVSKCIRSAIDVKFGTLYDETKNVVFTPNFTAKYVKTSKKDTSVFDGNFAAGSWFGADDANAYYNTGSDWKGADDCSVKGTLLWDEKNLYVYCEITDDTFRQTKTGEGIWQGDSIQLGIQNLTMYAGLDGEFVDRSSYNELGFAKTPQGIQMYRWSGHPTKNMKLGLVEDYKCDIETKGNKTIYKIAIPWTEAIGEETVKEGQELMFSMVANDDDGADREGFMMLTEGLGSTKSATKFSIVTLNK